MPKITNYTCDFPGCNNVRGEANHWFLGLVQEAKNHGIPYISIMPLTPSLNLYKYDVILCSEAHVIQWVSSQIGALFQAETITKVTPISTT